MSAAAPRSRAPRRRWLLEGIADTGVRASVETALERGEGGQTGPISRADDATVAEHLALLSEQALLVAQAYRALGLLTVDRLLDAGVLDTEQASRVLRSLEEAP